MPIKVLLPADRTERAPLALAAGLASFAGAPLGVVDNGLWRSMPLAIAAIARAFASEGVVLGETTPFNHLAADFAEQQARVPEFGRRHGAVVTGLGN